MFPQLAEAIEHLEVPVSGPAIAAALALRDRLDARISEAVGHFDNDKLWELDGATSATAWLRANCDRSGREAGRLSSHARRLRRLPALSVAWRSGAMGSGAVSAVLGIVGERHLELFSEHEASLVPTLCPLPLAEVVRAMQEWKARADALADDDDDEPERSLYAAQTLAGRVELKGSLDADTGSVVLAALRLAQTRDVEGEPSRTPAERRADALGDVCRFFLDHQQTHKGGRRRPHVNVVVHLDDLEAGRGGQSADGLRLSSEVVSRLLCDSALHRVVMAGRSAVLDYGTSTRTIPAPLWNALVVRDRHCRFPGCDRMPAWCEGHHVVWVEHGGETNLANLVLLCSRHHHLVHKRGWQAKLRPDGDLEVTAPDGRCWETHPPGVVRVPALL